MAWLVWIGTTLAVAGLALLAYCIAAAIRARRTATDDAEMRRRLGRLVAFNMAGLGVAAFGLMAVAVGLILR